MTPIAGGWWWISRRAVAVASAQDCPTGSLTAERLNGGGVRVTLREDVCANCGQCEKSCPRGAIRLVPSFVPAARDRAALDSAWVRVGSDDDA